MSDWLSADTFSELAEISERKGRQALAKAFSGGLWRNQALEVRTLHGRGGRSGIQYAVNVSSLPVHLQERLKALQTGDETVSKLRLGDDTARFERAWKHDVIKEALAHPKGSGQRKAEIDRLDGKFRLDWTGAQRKLTKSTLYKWIEIYETEGIHGLAQKVRSDRGEKKVLISRAWSKAVPFSDETKETILYDLKQYVRGLIKGGSQFKQTCVLASAKLRDITEAYGFSVAGVVAADELFSIPQSFVYEEMHYSAVYRHRSDRKASEDDRPRVRRTIAGLQPMEVVVADVHHINVQLLREDGTAATPKLIAFYDVATHRFFYEVIFFENGGGVRNIDVIRAFINMCVDFH